ncbi:hypothetical protein M2322_004621 [Rhodoblastus acidophilus]|uniref:GvpL/GvpF family gas vesicle protein n=1 Tax=Rhodoblastus acidophilus TaxID=1074 RepID=UPI0022259923|nr:hypothetical protein [Rhodoblastus acidophilus]
MTKVRLIGVAAGEAPPGWIALGEFAALIEPGAPGLGVDGARRHHASVLAASRRGPFLPAPFGRAWPSTAALVAALDARTDAFAAGLALAADCAEWSVRAPELPMEASSGRAWLRGQARRRTTQTALDTLGAEMKREGVAVDWRRPHDGSSLALLIHVERMASAMDALRQRFEADFAALPRLAGPWPLYSFTCLRGVSAREAA